MAANTSRINTSLVDAQFLEDIVQLLTAQPDMFVVTEGWRDGAREAALHAAYLADPAHAPKATDPSNSAHVGANFMDGCARAVDVTLVRAGKDVWEADDLHLQDPGWISLVAAIKAHPRLHSLASIGDYDHIEKLHWQQDRLTTTTTT